MNNALDITTALKGFEEAFSNGIKGIVKAAEIYVAAIDANPKNADLFAEKFKDTIPAASWSSFEAVGRKWMHPRLLLGGVSDPVKNRAIKRLPYSVQERVFNHERLPLLCSDGSTLQIDLLEATSEQCEQLCNGSSLRSVSEQKAFIEARKIEPKSESVEVLPYTISDGKVRFRRGVVLSRQEVKRILQEM